MWCILLSLNCKGHAKYGKYRLIGPHVTTQLRHQNVTGGIHNDTGSPSARPGYIKGDQGQLFIRIATPQSSGTGSEAA
jgi:hypothetical protein